MLQKNISSNEVTLTSDGNRVQREGNLHQTENNFEKLNIEDVSLLPERKRFELEKVLSILRDEPSLNEHKKKCSSGCSEKHGLLHSIFSSRPPLSIVQNIFKNFGGMNQTDCMNRCPLHVALMHGSSYDIINFLVGQDPTAVDIPDADGKTSLHLAIENYEHSNFDFEFDHSLIYIIEILCTAAPLTVTMEDKNEMNPIELAIEKELDYQVVRKLQKIAVKSQNQKSISARMA